MLLAIALFCAANCPARAQRATFILPETGAKISLTFAPAKDRDAIPSFRITSGADDIRFAPKNGIVKVPATSAERLETGVQNHISGLKLDPSRYFFSGSYTTGSQTHTLLFFVGLSGIGAAPVYVVGFTAQGKPYKVLELDEFDVDFFAPSDESARIIGKATLSEVMGGEGRGTAPYATTYDPFAVYVVKPDAPAAFSLAETRSYNQAHYVWAGTHSREDVGVLFNLPGHRGPLLATPSHIDEILTGKKP